MSHGRDIQVLQRIMIQMHKYIPRNLIFYTQRSASAIHRPTPEVCNTGGMKEGDQGGPTFKLFEILRELHGCGEPIADIVDSPFRDESLWNICRNRRRLLQIAHPRELHVSKPRYTHSRGTDHDPQQWQLHNPQYEGLRGGDGGVAWQTKEKRRVSDQKIKGLCYSPSCQGEKNGGVFAAAANCEYSRVDGSRASEKG